MAVDDIDWRVLIDQLAAEHDGTACGAFVLVLQFAVIHSRFTSEDP